MPRAQGHLRRLMQRHLADRRRRIVNISGNTNFTLKGLSKWSKEGLDLTDLGLSKLHSKESTFEKDKKKYDLSSETFKTYIELLIEKVERIHAVEQCTVDISNTKKVFMLKEYSSISNATMKVKRDKIWPTQLPATVTDQSTANKFTDA